MRTLGDELAIEQAAQARLAAELVEGAPLRTYVDYPKPSAITDWVENGQVVKGHEANGLALPWHIVETLGQPGPPQWVVVGEERYSDGRWYLDFAVSQVWTRYRAAETACELCNGLNGEHESVTINDQLTGRPIVTLCPNAPARVAKAARR